MCFFRRLSRCTDPPWQPNLLQLTRNGLFAATVLHPKVVGDQVEVKLLDSRKAFESLPDELLLRRTAQILDQIRRYLNF